MFAILVSYVKPLEVIDRFLPDHMAFLEERYQVKVEQTEISNRASVGVASRRDSRQ